MQQIEKNNVPSKDQLKTSGSVFFENLGGKGLRVLFVGNSITLHGYKADIGWFGESYGMAASAKEKDYVHLVMSEIYKRSPDAAMCICQAADWERNYRNGTDVLDKYSEARAFGADLIIFRIVENCPQDNYNAEVFENQYKQLIDYLNPDGKAKILLTTGFWKHIADSAIMSVGRERGYNTLYLGELGEDDSMKAIGLFEHSGVANHPGDKGMEAIAKTIVDAL